MSGVFGYACHLPGQTPGAELLSRMANAVALQPWHKTQTAVFQNQAVGLGQANISIISTDPQPRSNADHTVSVAFFGEIYNAEALRQQLKSTGIVCRDDTDTELVLRLYEDCAFETPARIQGVFTLAIWDSVRKKVMLANDRYGLLPHYYTHRNGKLVFGPLVAAILQEHSFEKKLNLDGLADFIRFQRLLGDKTFFEGLFLLPYASRLVYSTTEDQVSIDHYWNFDQIPTWPAGASFEDAVEETARLLDHAVYQMLQRVGRVGVFLSGGLDSRTLLGFASQAGKTLPSVTYGYPHTTYVNYAMRIAKPLGSKHHYFPQENGRWMTDHVDFHLAATEGHTSFIHAHAAIALEPSRQIFDVNLTGFNGDQLLGARAVEHAALQANAVDEVAFTIYMYQGMTHDFSWPGMSEADEKFVFEPSFYPQMRDRAFHSLQAALRPFSQYPFDRRLDYFTAIYQGARMSNLNVVYHRNYLETRYPFFDYPLLDFVSSVPLDYRVHDRLYLAMLNRAIPKVTWVPRDTNDMLLTDQVIPRTLHALATKAARRVKRRLFPMKMTQLLHGDPEHWLRDDLQEWAGNILFDKRTVERGIFNPSYVRSIFERHMCGREIWTIGKIAPLITFEMMMRKFFDGTP